MNGGDLIIKPTIRQRGGFVGSLLAYIGIPLLLGALKGSGVQNRPPPRYAYGVQNRPRYGRGKKKQVV